MEFWDLFGIRGIIWNLGILYGISEFIRNFGIHFGRYNLFGNLGFHGGFEIYLEFKDLHKILGIV